MRKLCVLAALAATCGLAVVSNGAADENGAQRYVVLFEQGASAADAHQAIKDAGGTLVSENRDVGLATVTSTRADFAQQAGRSAAIQGAAQDRAIGRAPQDRPKRADVERLDAARRAHRGEPAASADASVAGDPLASLQWDMQAIHATADGSYARQQGSKAVRVGVMDTGIDASHPDIAPNFDHALSRNFTTDDPVIDGSCESDPDGSCTDPPDVDEDGHGTHVAGTIAAPLNGLGMAGVAPNVDLVNLRAGQDSGYFFLQPTVDALTYAGDNGIDVVNMSFYIDPWLYNCAANPADSPDEQAQQRTIIAATQRALAYARDHGVTLVSAEGNEHTDLGHPTSDDTSPDYPPDTAHDRSVDNGCLSMPTEGEGVIGVSATGPSGQKAYYSNYGTEQTDVAAPGGDYRDFHGTPRYKTPQNLVLAPYPAALARANGELNPDGTPNTPFVVRDCAGATCAYYQYLQGTSMASPHAVGVVALIVSQFGSQSADGLTLAPDAVEDILYRSATKTACPKPRLYDYPSPDLGPAYDAYCDGGKGDNGFFGHGVVDALGAVTAHG